MSLFADMTTSRRCYPPATSTTWAYNWPIMALPYVKATRRAVGAGAAVAWFPPNHERFMLLRRYILITCLGKSNAVDS